MKLKALESYTRDVGRGIVRIDHDTMNKLDIDTGDPVRLSFHNKISTVSIIPLYPSDEGKGIIRIDGISRNNIGCIVGDMIYLSKTNPQNARTVVCTPLETIPPIDERYLADATEGTYFSNNDCFMVPYFGGRLSFQVIEVTPNESKVTPQTKFTILDKIKEKVENPNEFDDAKSFRNLHRIFSDKNLSLVKFSDELKAMDDELILLKSTNHKLMQELEHYRNGTNKDPNIAELKKLRERIKKIKSVVNN